MELDAFIETGHSPLSGRVHDVERRNRKAALRGLGQVDNSMHNRWVSVLLLTGQTGPETES